MPIYEYECKKCGRITEERKGKLEKLISLSSFQLTGTGWYATDYAKGPGIPPQVQEQDNPAVDTNTDSTNSSDATATVAESGPTSATDAFKSIEKETKKAKSKSKTT